MDQEIANWLFYVCLFLLGICAVEHYLKHSLIPPVCWMLLAGLVYGLAGRHSVVNSLPHLSIEPDVVLYIFLPVLLFDSARKLKLTELRSVGLESGLFATVGILASTVLIGVPFAMVAKVPMRDALLFGAVLSATDPIAISAVFSKFPLPEKLRTLVESESLLNDGTTLILFSLLSGTVLEGKMLTVSSSVIEFIVSVSGAIVLGVVIGYAGGMLMRWWHVLHDLFLGALLPLIFVYLTFGIAEHVFHVSGVISVMCSTLVLSLLHQHKGSAQRTADKFFNGFYDFLGNLANYVLFFLLGAEIGNHSFELPGLTIPMAIIILLLTRSVVVYAGAGILRVFRVHLPMSWQHVVNVAGLKGALSVALILLLPDQYKYRDPFLCYAFVMILFTLIGNTLVMQLYLKRTDITG